LNRGSSNLALRKWLEYTWGSIGSQDIQVH